MQVPLVA